MPGAHQVPDDLTANDVEYAFTPRSPSGYMLQIRPIDDPGQAADVAFFATAEDCDAFVVAEAAKPVEDIDAEIAARDADRAAVEALNTRERTARKPRDPVVPEPPAPPVDDGPEPPEMVDDPPEPPPPPPPEPADPPPDPGPDPEVTP